MTNTCTKVFLRRRPYVGGKVSLYLDYYPAIRNPHTNKMTRRETLGIVIYAEPANEMQRRFNQEMEEKAEAIRCIRYQSLINEQFGFLLDAFKYGVPPHAGLAYGLDRVIMLMVGADSIRDVIAFPKVKDASCLMMEAPSEVDVKQLEELHIAVVPEEKEQE